MTIAFRLSSFVLAGLFAAGLATAGTPAQALSTEDSDPVVLRLDQTAQAQAPTTPAPTAQAPAQTPAAVPTEQPAAAGPAAGAAPVASPAASRSAMVAKPKPVVRAPAVSRSVRSVVYRSPPPPPAYLVASRFERVLPLVLGVGF